MKLGIIGLNGAGRKTLFEAITCKGCPALQKDKQDLAVVTVPDERVDYLSSIYKPKKTTYAKVEYLLPAVEAGERRNGKPEDIWNLVRNCDALVQVIRNFNGNGSGNPKPTEDFRKIEQELILSDLIMVENRLARLEAEAKRGKKMNQEEFALLTSCKEKLEMEQPLNQFPEIAAAPLLKGFALLSAKQRLILFNNEDDSAELPPALDSLAKDYCLAVQGKIESEIAGMSQEEAAEFMCEFGIAESALNRVIRRSYELLGLMSFFTVGEDEVRAWTIRQGTQAVDAAEVIHSDIKRGFIRAEVIAYNDFVAAGNMVDARKLGKVRLEGKNYIVQEGDIINFRFNV